MDPPEERVQADTDVISWAQFVKGRHNEYVELGLSVVEQPVNL